MSLAFTRAGLAHLRAGLAKQMRTVMHLGNASVALVAAFFAECHAFAHVGQIPAGVSARLAIGGAGLAAFDDLVVVVHSYSAIIA